MTTQLNKDAKIILKLDLGEDGLRRIPIKKIWDDATGTVSFNILVQLILSYKKLGPKAVENERVSVITTYTDEDGDEITISSASELSEAFEQYTNSMPPVLRAKAVVVRHKKVDIAVKKEIKQEIRKERQLLHEVRKEVNKEQRNLCKSKRDSNKVVTVSPVVRLPSVAPPKAVPKSINALKCSADLNPNFIHGRHTCDGCLTTPIFGLRYHATNLPDYDLCSKCHANYTDKEIVFQPVQLDRDNHLQARWQRRHGRQCGPSRTHKPRTGRPNRILCLPEVASGTQTKKVIEGMDDELKEAIRRSLIDAWPVKKKQLKADKTSVEKISKEEEPDIPIATVVDIEAGNEKTQEALDNMDPKVKEALRNKLNAFFERRTNVSKSVDQEKDEGGLLPNAETQRKIDLMDRDTKEAIRRSLNNFFENRQVSKNEAKEESNTEVTSEDRIKRTKEILDSMDEESKTVIRKLLSNFLARRSNRNESSAEQSTSALPSVVIDFVVDNDLSVGTDDTDVDVEKNDNATEEDVESTKDEEGVQIDDDREDDIAVEAEETTDSDLSTDSWQIVSDDEMIAVAAQMLGSALFESDASIDRDSKHDSE